MKKCLNLEYDVVLSFAGEDRKYVEQTAKHLRKAGIKVFYDMYEDVKLWGKDLYQHLDDIYQNKAKYAVVFVSEAYGKKLWPSHELKSAQARAFTASEEYILPAKFDDTEIPGIRKTTAYVSLKELSPLQFSKKIIKKLGDIEPEEFLPDNPKYVREAINAIFEDIDDETIDLHVSYVFGILKKTTSKERNFLINVLIHSCKHNIIEDLHEDITLFERVTNLSKDEIRQILKSLTNIGFEYKITKSIHGSKEDGNEQDYELLSLKLGPRHAAIEFENLTIFLTVMYFGATIGQCSSCKVKTLARLDFTGLKDGVKEDDLEQILLCVPDNDEASENNH